LLKCPWKNEDTSEITRMWLDFQLVCRTALAIFCCFLRHFSALLRPHFALLYLQIKFFNFIKSCLHYWKWQNMCLNIILQNHRCNIYFTNSVTAQSCWFFSVSCQGCWNILFPGSSLTFFSTFSKAVKVKKYISLKCLLFLRILDTAFMQIDCEKRKIRLKLNSGKRF